MSTIIWLNEDRLILVRQVQGLLVILLDGEMESGYTSLNLSKEFGVFAVVGSDQIGTSEAVLRVSPRRENRAVVDRDGNNLFGGDVTSLTPKRSCENVLSEESGVLYTKRSV